MKGRLNTISLRRNSQDSLIVEAPDGIPSEFCKLFLTIAVSDWDEMVAHLPEDHERDKQLGDSNNHSTPQYGRNNSPRIGVEYPKPWHAATTQLR
jgi:hypothetical protein